MKNENLFTRIGLMAATAFFLAACANPLDSSKFSASQNPATDSDSETEIDEVSAVPASIIPAHPGKYVILKLDDLHQQVDEAGLPVTKGANAVIHARFKQVAAWLTATGTKASFGLICSNSFYNQAFSDWIKGNAIENGGTFEFWLHGFDHMQDNRYYAEFLGTGLTYQVSHIRQACDRLTANTGLVFHTFAPPGNAGDADSVQAVNQFPSIKVWMYGPSDPSNRMVATNVTTQFIIPRLVELESAPGKVYSLTEFIQRPGDYDSYSLHQGADLCLQGHPSKWDTNSFANFYQVVAFLKSEGYQFTTPYEFHRDVLHLQ